MTDDTLVRIRTRITDRLQAEMDDLGLDKPLIYTPGTESELKAYHVGGKAKSLRDALTIVNDVFNSVLIERPEEV